MTILEQLDCELNKGGLFTLVSNFGSGKTTILSIIASELVLAGKNVVYMNSEEAPKTLQRKFNNLLPSNQIIKGKLIIKKTTNAVGYVTHTLEEEKDIDVVILDGYFGNKENIKELAVTKNIAIIETKQLERALKGVLTQASTQLKFMERSDVVVNLVRDYEFTKLTGLEKLKNFLFFWKARIVENELLKLAVLKNRTGKDDIIIEYPINFGKLNKI
jgi:ABC-type cobalamin/Fe3+-siderophores transport system ATPase subunit